MSTNKRNEDSRLEVHYPPTSTIERSEYIDITPYQQKGDPCYGGDTGETEYENYMKGCVDRPKRKIHNHSIP